MIFRIVILLLFNSIEVQAIESIYNQLELFNEVNFAMVPNAMDDDGIPTGYIILPEEEAQSIPRLQINFPKVTGHYTDIFAISVMLVLRSNGFVESFLKFIGKHKIHEFDLQDLLNSNNDYIHRIRERLDQFQLNVKHEIKSEDDSKGQNNQIFFTFGNQQGVAPFQEFLLLMKVWQSNLIASTFRNFSKTPLISNQKYLPKHLRWTYGSI